MSRFSLYSLVLLAGVGSGLAACSSDDDSAGGSGGTGGKASAGAAGKAPGPSEGGASGEGGEGGSTADSLYTRLKGHAGIKAAIGAIVAKELTDDDIASFFAPNLKDSSHIPQPGDIIDCFTALLGKAADGPEQYPYTTDTGFTCRSMADSHADLHIGSDTFDHFVSIAAGVLKSAKVSDADIATIGGVLVGTKSDIVDPDAPPSGPCISPACEVPGEGGAGGAGGAAGSN